MEKIVDGVELLLMIENGTLKNKKVYYQEIYYNPDTHKDEKKKMYLFIDDFGAIGIPDEDVKDVNNFRKLKFHIEDDKEDEEIDIDSIEELSESECLVEILKIVKQLKKEWEEK